MAGVENGFLKGAGQRSKSLPRHVYSDKLHLADKWKKKELLLPACSCCTSKEKSHTDSVRPLVGVLLIIFHTHKKKKKME